jgi:hypothetical protein
MHTREELANLLGASARSLGSTRFGGGERDEPLRCEAGATAAAPQQGHLAASMAPGGSRWPDGAAGVQWRGAAAAVRQQRPGACGKRS